MNKIWKGEIFDGGDYQFIFKRNDDKRVVQVHEVTSQQRTGATTKQTTSNAIPVEIKDMPLERQEAEDLVQRYLSDRHDNEKERVIERLCAVDDLPEFRTY